MNELNLTTQIDPEITQRLDLLLQRHLEPDGSERSLTELVNLLAGYRPLCPLGANGDVSELWECLSILRKVYPELKRLKDRLNIKASLLPETFTLYIPIARFMAARSRELRERAQRAVVFGINGGQGSGKTTINSFLQVILREGLGLRPAGFSIDDVYKTYAQRQAMAQQVHPLFAIRSVAGTHDTALASNTLDALAQARTGDTVAVPRFDKMAKGGEGDRLPETEWPLVEGPVDVVIFEGWCVGARPEPEQQLVQPINQREAEQDPDGAWRGKANQLLASDYRELFARIDELLVIQVRSMEDVYRNRELQEQHLRDRLAKARERGEDTGELGAMSPQQVIDFISLYERTTRQMLATLPEVARLTLYIGDHHRVEKVRINTPLSFQPEDQPA